MLNRESITLALSLALGQMVGAATAADAPVRGAKPVSANLAIPPEPSSLRLRPAPNTIKPVATRAAAQPNAAPSSDAPKAPPVSERLPAPNNPAAESKPPVPPESAFEAEPIPVGRDMVPGLRLLDVEQLAMGNSPLLREAQAQVVAARGRAVQAGLPPNPLISTASPQLAGSSSQYNVYISQDIITRGKLGLDSAALWRAARQAELQVTAARFQVLTDARTLYITALAAQQRRDALEKLVGIADRSAETGRALLAAGQWARGDAIPLEIELERAQLQLENTLTVLEAAKRQLAATLGVPDMIIPAVVGDFKLPLPAYDQMAIEQGVISRNTLARVAEIEIARTEIRLRHAEVEPFPNLNFQGGYQYSVQDPNQQGIYQLTMAVPLWNRNQGNIRAAQADVSNAIAGRERVRNELTSNTAAALGRFVAARQSVQRYTRINVRAQELYEQGQRLKQQGEVDLLRVLLGQRTLFEANLDYISAQERLWAAAAEVSGLLQSESFP